MKLLIAIFPFIFSGLACFAQSPKEIVEKKWTGTTEQDADFTANGKVYLQQILTMSLLPNDSIVGNGTVVMTLDGKSYTSIALITGRFYPETWSVYIAELYYTHKDELPNKLQWCKGWGALNFYENAELPGHYLLKGDMGDECDGTSYVELHDE